MKTLFLATFACALRVWAADSTLCYDQFNSYAYGSIDGWVADSAKSHDLGLCVLYYPASNTFDDSPVVMYPNLVSLDHTIDTKGLPAFIAGDLEKFKQKSAKIKTEDAVEFASKKGYKFLTVKISNGPSPNEFEKIAYHAGNKAVLLAVLSARNETDLKKYEDKFTDFLNTIEEVKRSSVFEYLKKGAEEFENSATGKAFSPKFFKSLASKLSSELKACGINGGGKVEAILSISPEGQIVDWMNKTDSTERLCLKSKMTGKFSEAPPSGAVKLYLKLTVKP